MDLLAKLFFSQPAYRLRHILREGVIYLFLVVVDGSLWILQVANIVEHVDRVPQSHQEVIHLIKSMSVSDDLLQKEREESSVPIEESASGRLADHDFPAWHHLELLIPEQDVLELFLSEHVSID